MSEAAPDTVERTVIRDLTAFQKNVLFVLAEEPMYGLAIKRELEAFYDDEVNHGRLYPNLDDLADMGLIKKTELDKRTNQYELTDEAAEAIIDYLDWVLSRTLEYPGFSERIEQLIE